MSQHETTTSRIIFDVWKQSQQEEIRVMNIWKWNPNSLPKFNGNPCPEPTKEEPDQDQSSHHSSLLLDLPSEVLAKLLSFLPASSIISLTLTGKAVEQCLPIAVRQSVLRLEQGSAPVGWFMLFPYLVRNLIQIPTPTPNATATELTEEGREITEKKQQETHSVTVKCEWRNEGWNVGEKGKLLIVARKEQAKEKVEPSTDETNESKIRSSSTVSMLIASSETLRDFFTTKVTLCFKPKTCESYFLCYKGKKALSVCVRTQVVMVYELVYDFDQSIQGTMAVEDRNSS